MFSQPKWEMKSLAETDQFFLGAGGRMSKKRVCFLCMLVFAAVTLRMVAKTVRPAFAGASTYLSAQETSATRPATSSSQPARATTRIQRAPVRVLEDPGAAYSAVAVDPSRNEIVLQDENRENIMVYNRLDNTPPSAAMSEPKRMIGGPKTKIAMNCGVYVDPLNGDIYSLSGDTMNTMTVFSRETKGNAPPDRELETPHRTFAVAVDEETQELFLTIQHPPAVVVYHKMAKQNEAPLRILEGDHTQLADAHGIALDTKNKVMYVSNRGDVSYSNNGIGWARALTGAKQDGSTWVIPEEKDAWSNLVPGSGKFNPPSITVYPLKASGDTPPLRVIQGPKTQLNWPAHIHMDVEHGELFVANPIGDSVLVFRASDSGDVAPVRILKGPRTGIKSPHGVFVDEKNQEVVVANFGNHSATVYSRTAAGDTPPIRTIRSAFPDAPSPMLGNVGALAYDSKRDEILAPN
jgi:DNA-binding beta-propeller fold protein YncE